jgi:hypothetical protein
VQRASRILNAFDQIGTDASDFRGYQHVFQFLVLFPRLVSEEMGFTQPHGALTFSVTSIHKFNPASTGYTRLFRTKWRHGPSSSKTSHSYFISIPRQFLGYCMTLVNYTSHQYVTGAGRKCIANTICWGTFPRRTHMTTPVLSEGLTGVFYQEFYGLKGVTGVRLFPELIRFNQSISSPLYTNPPCMLYAVY